MLFIETEVNVKCFTRKRTTVAIAATVIVVN